MQALQLDRLEEALGASVIVGITGSTHALSGTNLEGGIAEVIGRILAPTVGVEDEPLPRLAAVDRTPKCRYRQLPVDPVADSPTHDSPGEQIHHAAQVQEPFARRDIRHV